MKKKAKTGAKVPPKKPMKKPDNEPIVQLKPRNSSTKFLTGK